ncbi:MAG: site-specific integrase [Proteobacteria bacterium]|nr:site-specific integrase [Pseudomonadota bacterium]
MVKGIYKRGNIFWIRYAGLDGKTIYESTHSNKFQDAVTLLGDQKKLVRDGKQPNIKKKISNVTFKELAVEYVKWAERQRAYNQKVTLINQLVGIFGNHPLRYFTTMLLEQYQTERMQRGNKPATINRHLATIKHMFTKAVEWDYVEDEVLKRVRKVKQLEENNRRLRYLSQEECQDLINACDPHLRPLVVTALNTGMRFSEIVNLRWDKHVDLRHGFILLDKTKNGTRREIPVNATLRATLQGLARRLDIPYVFFNPSSEKPYQRIQHSFATALKKAGIRDFRFHDLRHTFASHLVMAGVDITTVSRLLGHKDLTMTLRYAHLSPNHMSKAVDILDNVLNEKTNYTKTIQLGYNGNVTDL